MDTDIDIARASGEDSVPSSNITWNDLIVEIDHVAVAVENLQQAIDWYVKVLGYVVLERRETRGRTTGMLSAVLRAGRSVVVLLQGTSPQSQVSRFISACGAGVQHIAFLVKDFDEALDRVKSAGVTVDTSIIEDAGIRQVFLGRDSGSGVRVELIERRGGTFTDASVQRLFLDFESRNLY